MDLSYSKQYKKMYKYIKQNFEKEHFSSRFLSYDLNIRIEDINNLISLLTTYNLIKREYGQGNYIYSFNSELTAEEVEKIFESIDLALQYIDTNRIAMKDVVHSTVSLTYEQIKTQFKFDLKEKQYAYIEFSKIHKNLKPHLLRQKLVTDFEDCYVRLYEDKDNKDYNKVVLLKITPDLIKLGKISGKARFYLGLSKLDLLDNEESVKEENNG